MGSTQAKSFGICKDFNASLYDGTLLCDLGDYIFGFSGRLDMIG